mmetsp:Transcript_50000/g.131771  ORF Transcript_50000/g.131771 Transcript_50000/m.131771 type:complete len:90 (+) Transcript_50000:1-270(+)
MPSRERPAAELLLGPRRRERTSRVMPDFSSKGSTTLRAVEAALEHGGGGDLGAATAMVFESGAWGALPSREEAAVLGNDASLAALTRPR